jgi:hypothetical protein
LGSIIAIKSGNIKRLLNDVYQKMTMAYPIMLRIHSWSETKCSLFYLHYKSRTTYFMWWKSWNSGEHKKGKWYPECVMADSIIADKLYIHAVAMWSLNTINPAPNGRLLRKNCSTGCTYRLAIAIVEIYSWCTLCMCL